MNAGTVPGIQGIDHLHVYVSERGAAEQWYREVLGCERVEKYATWATPEGPLVIENSASSLHFALFERQQFEPSTALALSATAREFKLWRAHLKGHGVEVRLADHDLAVSMYFEDPDRNGYEITTYDREQVLDEL